MRELLTHKMQIETMSSGTLCTIARMCGLNIGNTYKAVEALQAFLLEQPDVEIVGIETLCKRYGAENAQ